MAAYPAVFDIEQPPKFDRVHIAIRVLILIIMSIIGSVWWLVYLGVPVVAAIQISQKGSDGYLRDSPQTMTKWLGYLVAFYAYLGLLTDRLPNEDISQTLRFEVQPGGTHTTGSAVLRIIKAIPSAIVLGIISILGAILALIAAIMVLVQETYPESIYAFLRGVMRWHVRLLVYLASLVEPYPPFALDTGREAGAPGPGPAQIQAQQ